MPFRRILEEMVRGVEGSIAALFLDYEGEAIEIVCSGGVSEEIRIVGAYQGIFLEHLRRISRSFSWGQPERFKIDLTASRIFSSVVNEDYYVVLIAVPSSNEGNAWHRIGRCRDALLREIG
ncbi:MAG TPA: hypothetical protein VMT00_02765 [Thermoanaerobaculia bacterium]|nr:hypothetical protein [Thermoanaerobaculia bacterium]